VPVVVHREGQRRIEIARADGLRQHIEALELDGQISAEIFERSGAIRRLDVYFGIPGGGRNGV